MPIVFVHGVAVRDEDPTLAPATRAFGEVPWPAIEAQLREHVAPAVSDDPAGVPIKHLGGWWNVWDHADLLSFRAGGIVEGVDDSPFFAAGTLATDHYRYLANAGFYRALAARVRDSIGPPDGR